MPSFESIAVQGDHLSIFHCENGRFIEDTEFEGVKSTNSTNGRCLSWAGDGQWMTGPVINSAGLPLYRYEKNTLKPMRFLKDTDITAASCFNCTNLNVAVGTLNGSVKIWNVKEKTVSKTLCHADFDNPVRFIELNADDNYCAVSPPYSLNPVVKVYGLTTTKLLNRLSLDSAAEITDLRFSTIKKGYLGCCTMEGAIIVWDILTSSRLLSLTDVHPGSGTGMSMSPFNQSLVASVGYSGGFKCHDIRTQKKVFEMPVSGATCVDLLQVEPMVVIGTKNGQIKLLDLRVGKIVDEVAAFKTSVQSVRVAISTKRFEEANVGTPEILTTVKDEAVDSATVCSELSIYHSDSPEFRISMQKDNLSRVGFSFRNSTSPGIGAQSTPNPDASDFLQMINNSVGSNIAPSPLAVKATPSPLLQKVFQNQCKQQQTLNGIIEESEHIADAVLNKSINGGHPQVHNVVPEELRTLIRQEVNEAFNDLREEIRRELNTTTHELRSLIEDEMQRNRSQTHCVIRYLEQLYVELRLSNVISGVTE